MSSDLNLPDGFITILEARTRRGRALYDKRWPEIEKASDDQVSMGGLTAFAIQIGADRETIQSLGERVVEVAGLSWKYRTRTVTDLLDWLYLGTLKGYLFRPGHIPEVQPKGVWKDPKLLQGLLAGYVYEGNPKQQRKAYIIVREDELAEALEADQPSALTKKAEPPDKPAGATLPTPKKRGGGLKRGPYYGPLERHLKWRKDHIDDLDTASLADLRKEARKRLTTDRVKGIPKSRSAFDDAIRAALRTLDVNR